MTAMSIELTYEALKADLFKLTNKYEANANTTKPQKYKKKRQKAADSKGEKPPTNVEQAMNHPTRSWEWFNFILDEWECLTKIGVLDHNYTIEQCREMGIDTEPVPITIVLDHKYDEDGELKKLKCRIAVRGTQKYMQPGTHYDPNTYAATPNMNSTRILMALVALYGLFQKCFDITKAYTWAELDKKDLLILKYPKHFERYDTNTHEPL